MTATPDSDVIVVGAGVMGLSLALALAQRARRVLVLDRSAPGREASAATAGTLAVQNKPLASIPLTLRALQIWQTMERGLGRTVEYEVRGGLRVAHTAEDLDRLRRSAIAQRAAGAPVELLDAAEVFRLAPYLSRNICAATWCPLDGMANPFLAVRVLSRACRDAGVGFALHTPVERVKLSAGGGVEVQGGGTAFQAAAGVLASGAWIPTLVPEAAFSLPIAAKVQQVLITDSDAAPLPHVITHVRGNLTLKQQHLTRKVLVGGGWSGIGDEARRGRRLSFVSMIGNARAAIETVPALAGARLLRAWTGYEGRTPDKLPLIGPLPGAPGLFVLGCGSGGLTIAPAAAELLVQQMCGEVTTVRAEPFLPERFSAHVAFQHPA